MSSSASVSVSYLPFVLLQHYVIIAHILSQEKVHAREKLFAAHKLLSTLTKEDQREEYANFLRLAEELDSTLRNKTSTSLNLTIEGHSVSSRCEIC